MIRLSRQLTPTRLERHKLGANRYRVSKDFDDSVDLGGPLAVAGLAVAVFDAATPYLTSGSFSWKTNTPIDYLRPWPLGTRPVFKPAAVHFRISAHHPRYFIDTQHFWFELLYDYNGYDLRDINIHGLLNKSSSLIASTFFAAFSGRPYSEERDPAVVRFRIEGTWDPVGSGATSFSGYLEVRAGGGLRFWVGSENEWVWNNGLFW